MKKIIFTLALASAFLMFTSVPSRADGNIGIAGASATPTPTPPPSRDGNIGIAGRGTDSSTRDLSIWDFLIYLGL